MQQEEIDAIKFARDRVGISARALQHCEGSEHHGPRPCCDCIDYTAGLEIHAARHEMAERIKELETAVRHLKREITRLNEIMDDIKCWED